MNRIIQSYGSVLMNFVEKVDCGLEKTINFWEVRVTIVDYDLH